MRKEGHDTTPNDYVKVGHMLYGNSCEFLVNGKPCGWNEAPCDVHHVNYVEHNEIEKKLGRQLPKSLKGKDLCVLCPNHHRKVHHDDMGLHILVYLPPRKMR